MRSVVVTGASTGIGWASAKLLLDKGFRVFGSVRKQADAERLKAEFGANFEALMFDITDEAAVLAGAREVRAPCGPAKGAHHQPHLPICLSLAPSRQAHEGKE